MTKFFRTWIRRSSGTRYAIKIGDLEQIQQIKREVESVEGIADVSAYEELASGFITLRNVATVICVALIAILFVVSVFITSNTIKLTTFDRREEIATCVWWAATKGFIRWRLSMKGSAGPFKQPLSPSCSSGDCMRLWRRA